MSVFVNIIISIVAILHIYFMILEMYYWDKPLGLKAFGLTKDSAKASKVLAANQGLYNGFLAAGLLWGVYLGTNGINITIFFLVCIIIAGIFGAITANRKILYIQALPASIALALILFFN
jgi:putative membrane protein